MIPFNKPPYVGTELDFVRQSVVEHGKISGDGPFTKKCHEWLEQRFSAQKVLLTTSGTAALEMAALLCNLQPGDEVILPSYTFSSTATAFVLVGAKLVFVDVRPDTMNLDEEKIEAAITEKTRVIVTVDYAGVACNMERICQIAHDHGLLVVEDAAQGVMSTYRGKALGTLADLGCYSFHETKNYSMGEGGALVINNPRFNEDAEVLREKGTNRSRFFRGQVDKYTWVSYGSSYLPSDMNAAFLWAQLQAADHINEDRLATWAYYHESFAPLAAAGKVELPFIPQDCAHNAHMYYAKCTDLAQRTALISYAKERGVMLCFHYVPLHSSPAGLKYGCVRGGMDVTDRESDRLVRLPMYYGMTAEERAAVMDVVSGFFAQAE